MAPFNPSGSLRRLLQPVREAGLPCTGIATVLNENCSGSKYLAIKPTQDYRSSTQPRSISHTAGTRYLTIRISKLLCISNLIGRVERPHTSGSRKDPRKSTSPGYRRQSPKYIERSDSCLESNKEVVQPALGNRAAKNDRPNKFSFERDRATSSPGTSRPRNSFSTRGWDMFDTGFAGNQTQPLTPDEDIRPHPRSGSVPHNVRPQVPTDQVRPNSSPQDSSRTRVPLSSETSDTLSPAHARKSLHSTTTNIRSGAPASAIGDFAFADKSFHYAEVSSVSHPTTVKAERRYSPKTSGYSTPSGRESTLTDSTGHSSMRQSPVSFSEKQNAPRGTPPNRPRRSGTSRSEKGGRTTSTISSRPRALSAQTGNAARPPDSPMEPVPPIPPPQLEVKQDLLLEALPPLDIPADAVEEMMTKSRENVRKFKMQHLLPDTSTAFHQQVNANTFSVRPHLRQLLFTETTS